MERIPDKMPEYTLHDPNHGAKVVEIMGLIIPSSTLEILNTIELSILIYSGYLHDLGMTCSTAERELIIASDKNFTQLLASDHRRSKQIELFKGNGDYRSATHVEDQVFTEYLRRYHVKRSANFIESELTQGSREIVWRGTPYWRLVQSVCDSHALPVKNLRDTRRWPRDALVRNVRVNVQYLALVLRLADILDLDPERTPKALLDFINPKDPTSIIEWNKHRSVIGWEITPERIQFEAECTDAVYERALREFIGWIEIERSDSVALASSYRDDIAQAYHLDLTDPVTTDRIRSNGSYIFSTLRFEVDHERVINLLMGERLYRSPALALRELIQNAFDAVRYRQAIEKREDSDFIPKISISLDDDKLSVEDNGIGMDKDTITNYFMQVGRSYYTSPQFRSQKLELDIVSEFGIGVLSAFMVAEHLVVESRRRPEDPFSPPEPVLIEIPTAHRYFVQRPSKKNNIGTKITLSLKDDHPFIENSLHKFIGLMVPFGEYPISININGEKFLHASKNSEATKQNKITENPEFLQIKIDSSNDNNLNGVTGIISIIGKPNEVPYEYFNHSIVAQCGFAVLQLDHDNSSRHPASELFPNWTQFSANLDFRPPSRLTLTPDRGSIVHDQQFEKIQKALDLQAVRGIEKHLNEKMATLSSNDYGDYVDQMIEEGALKAEAYIGYKLSEEARDLFLDYIPFECISDEGSFIKVMGRKLAENEIIILTDPRGWPEGLSPLEIRKEIDIYFGKKYPIIIDQDIGDYHREKMYDHIFSKISSHLILSIPGVVVDIINQRDDIKFDSYIDGIAHITFGLQSTVNRALPAIFHARSIDEISFEYPFINANHPIFFDYFNKFTSESKENLHEIIIVSLYEKIAELLTRSIAKLHNPKKTIETKGGKNHIRRHRYSILMYAPNQSLIGILNRDPELFSEIKLAFINYWQASFENGIIPPDKCMPDFSNADLPWFWSYSDSAESEN